MGCRPRNGQREGKRRHDRGGDPCDPSHGIFPLSL
jgi:hypothetical protein